MGLLRILAQNELDSLEQAFDEALSLIRAQKLGLVFLADMLNAPGQCLQKTGAIRGSHR